MLEGLNGGLAGHSREVVKEFVQCLPTFQIIEEGLQGNTRSPEYWRSTQHFGIARDDVI